jgi:hypothetical protein
MPAAEDADVVNSSRGRVLGRRGLSRRDDLDIWRASRTAIQRKLSVTTEETFMEFDDVTVTTQNIRFTGGYGRLSRAINGRDIYSLSDFSRIELRPNWLVIVGLALYIIDDINHITSFAIFISPIEVIALAIILYGLYFGAYLRVVAYDADGNETIILNAIHYNIGKKMVIAFQQAKQF